MSNARLPVPLGESSRKALSRLRPLHYRIIGLHLRGLKGDRIAQVLGIHPGTVSFTLHNPTAQAVIDQAYKDRDLEVRALSLVAVDRIRDALAHGDPRIYLSAARDALKINGMYDHSLSGEATAEDVIARILEVRTDGPATIRVGEARRR